MKRLIGLLVLSVFFLAAVYPVSAAETASMLSKEEAMQIAIDRGSVPSTMKMVGISFRQEENGNQVWSFNWMSGDPGKTGDITVEIDARDGKLRNFYTWSPDAYEGERRFSLKEAQAIAEEYVKKMNPEQFSQLRLELPVDPYKTIPEQKMAVEKTAGEKIGIPPMPAMAYSFNFTRIVNGYPYWNNSINVTVSSATGKIQSYNYIWDSEELPVVEDAVYLKQAKKIFAEKIGLELGCLRIWGNGEAQPEIALGYYPGNNVPMLIDAVTGEIIDYNGNNVTSSPNTGIPVSNEKVAEPPERAPMTMEEAQALAEKWVSVPAGYRPAGINYYENPQVPGQATWSFNWANTERDKYGYLNVGINARTGEVISISSDYGPYQSVKAEITQEQARDIAVRFLKEVAPSRLNSLTLNTNDPSYSLRPMEEKRTGYYFRFSRLVEGLVFPENGVDISVSGEGKVTSYYANWEQLKFPSSEGIISAEKAVDTFLTNSGFEVGYIRLREGWDWKVRLAYRVNNSDFFVDARTGKIRNRWQAPLLRESARYKDIQGHWAENDISKLEASKILDISDDMFRPEEPASRGEVTAMLVKALEINQYLPAEPTFADVSKENKNYGYIEAAYRSGIVKGDRGNFRPDDGITREALAVIIVKGLNSQASEGTEVSDKGTGESVEGTDESERGKGLNRFRDAAGISDWAAKDVHTAVNLGLFKGDERGYFNPGQAVTRAEAAALIARVLEI